MSRDEEGVVESSVDGHEDPAEGFEEGTDEEEFCVVSQGREGEEEGEEAGEVFGESNWGRGRGGSAIGGDGTVGGGT